MGALLGTLRRYWHTVRHLRASQIWNRVWFRVYRPRPDLKPPPPLRTTGSSFLRPPARAPSMLGPTRFRFLNRDGTVERPEDWNDSTKPKLWLYHLHYFDDLNARNAGERSAWHRDLLQRWIDDNPPAEGVGWEPYPTSRRIVNLIKWTLRENQSILPNPAVHSVAIQTRWLERRLERHLRGNHLLANAKALVFAGLFFEGEEAARWYQKGQVLLEKELDEQILEDGGHFERSPMYHALVLEDVLDLINLYRSYGCEVPDNWSRAAVSMKAWLEVMRHPDGRIPFFNDAAFGVALTPAELDHYAERLAVSSGENTLVMRPTRDLSATGYVRVEAGPAVAFLDVAPVGPDYLPAHGHADTLSFELSLGGHRLFVNSGTSTYEGGDRRDQERGTSAHNTLVVDGQNSSEVWGSFRVARRARIAERQVDTSEDTVRVAGTQDGYRRLKGNLRHRREWVFAERTMELLDRVQGSGRHDVDLWFHLHPSWKVVRSSEPPVVIRKRGGHGQCEIRFRGPGHVSLRENSYAPEFGRVQRTVALLYRVNDAGLPLEVVTHLSWSCDRPPLS